MAESVRPTLKLKPPAAKAAPKPEPVPLYDPKKCSELRGGVGLVQEDNVFNPSGGHGFVRKLPKEQGYYLTPDQQVNYSRQMARQKAAIVSAPAPAAAIPEKAMQIQRENSQAYAAEQYAE